MIITDDISALIEEAEHMLAILECRATEEMGGYDYVQPKIEKAKAALRAQAQEIERWKDTAGAEAEAMEDQKAGWHAAKARIRELEAERDEWKGRAIGCGYVEL